MDWREHQKLRRGVEEYVDGEADAALAASVREHLEGCWLCSEDAEWLAMVKATLRRMGTTLPASLSASRLTRFARALAGRS